MKYTFLIILVLSCILIGYIFSRKYRVRKDFFLSLVYLCQKFDIEINYSRERLKNIFDSLEEKHKSKLCGIDKNFISFINKEIKLDKDSLFKGINFLKENEKDIITMFFKTLGRSDVESQIKEIKNYQIKFDEMSNLAINENKKYGMLSLKLGIITGLLLIVILL